MTTAIQAEGLVKQFGATRALDGVADALRPIMLTLLFNYVLGGSIVLPGGGRYSSYLIPGILVQQVAFSSAITATGLATDVRNGILDRFRSLPIARSAYLIARILSDSARMLLTVALIVTVGLGLGFRFSGGFVGGVAGLALVIAFGISFAFISAGTALSVRDPEAVQMLWFVALMPLIFASSIFASPTRMPGWLQPVVRTRAGRPQATGRRRRPRPGRDRALGPWPSPPRSPGRRARGARWPGPRPPGAGASARG